MSLFAPTEVGTERFKMKGMALEIRLQTTISDRAEQCCVALAWVWCVSTQSLHGLFLSGVKVQCKANTITSNPKMCFVLLVFFFPSLSLTLCRETELSYFPFLIQELEGLLKPGIKLQEKEWRHLVAASPAHTVHPSDHFHRPPSQC